MIGDQRVMKSIPWHAISCIRLQTENGYFNKGNENENTLLWLGRALGGWYVRSPWSDQIVIGEVRGVQNMNTLIDVLAQYGLSVVSQWCERTYGAVLMIKVRHANTNMRSVLSTDVN